MLNLPICEFKQSMRAARGLGPKLFVRVWAHSSYCAEGVPFSKSIADKHASTAEHPRLAKMAEVGGKANQPQKRKVPGSSRRIYLSREAIESVNNLSVRDGASKLGVSTFTLRKRRLEHNIPVGEVSPKKTNTLGAFVRCVNRLLLTPRFLSFASLSVPAGTHKKINRCLGRKGKTKSRSISLISSASATCPRRKRAST